MLGASHEKYSLRPDANFFGDNVRFKNLSYSRLPILARIVSKKCFVCLIAKFAAFPCKSACGDKI